MSKTGFKILEYVLNIMLKIDNDNDYDSKK